MARALALQRGTWFREGVSEGVHEDACSVHVLGGIGTGLFSVGADRKRALQIQASHNDGLVLPWDIMHRSALLRRRPVPSFSI